MAEGQSLRAVLAELDMRVQGLGKVDEANVAIDKYVRSSELAATDTEKLRIEQQQAYETASRLGRQIRKLQKAEGDHSRQIKELRLAMARAKDSAKAYGREIRELEGDQSQAAATAGGTGRAGMVGSMRGAAGAIAGIAAAATAAVASVRVFTDAMRDTIALGAELDTTAQAIGLTTDALQEWQFISERVGVDLRDLRQGFGDLADAAAQGDEEFAKIGVSTRDSNDELKGMNQLMEETLVALGGMENDTERLSIAMKLFGEDAGASFVTMAKNAGSIDELRERVRELGGGLSEDGVKASVEAAEASQDFALAMTSLKGAIAKDVLPALTSMVKGIAPIVGSISEFLSKSNLVEAMLYALATAMGVLALAMLPVSGPLLVIVGAFAALVLVIDDVITAFQGGDSVIGDFVESILEMLGIESTFQGFFERFGVGWELLKGKVLGAVAAIVTSVAQMQKSLGIEVFGDIDQTAADLSKRASQQMQGAREAAVALQEREQDRRTERAAANVVRAIRGDVDARQEVTISEATDAEGVRRVLDEANEKQRKKIMDMFPSLAEGEAEGAPA